MQLAIGAMDAGGHQCECCGTPVKETVNLTTDRFEFKLNGVRKILKHVKDSHREYLETDEGRVRCTRQRLLIENMTAQLRVKGKHANKKHDGP